MDTFSNAWKLRSNRADDTASCRQGNLPLAQNAKISKMMERRKSVLVDEEKEENPESIIDRRLTIHCIVEEITTLDESKWKECPHNCGKTGKSSRENTKWWLCECRNIEMNSCVVIKASTSMSDLVKTVLTKLGYPSNASSSAMGSILIRNWKALSLSAICPSPKMTAGDVLGELSSLVTLQIQILRPKSAFVQEIKDRLLSFLIAKSHSLLSSSGCPLDLFMVTKLCEENAYVRKHMKEESSEEIRRRFEAWLNHVQKNEVLGREANCADFYIDKNEHNNNINNISNGIVTKSNAAAAPAVNTTTTTTSATTITVTTTTTNSNDTDCKSNNSSGTITSGSNSIGSTSSAINGGSPSQILSDTEYLKQNAESENRFRKNNPPGFEESERSDRSLHSAQTKTRMRTSFDPDLELPKLLKWYLENPHPTRQQIQEYVQELNSLESRRGRKKLDMNNVVYWFKNARAAQKRSEYRKFCNISMSGAKKNCNSLKLPVGKTSSIASDEHVTLSDDEPCIIAENLSANTFQNGKGKCMQVLGNWNANGAGEAVLEMQITPPKACQSSPPVKIENDHANDHEESSREGMLSIAEESVENLVQDSLDEGQKQPEQPCKVKDIHESSERVNSAEEKEFKFGRSDEDVVSNEEMFTNEKCKEGEIHTSRMRSKSNFITHKKLNGLNQCENSLLSRYKAEERRKRNRTFIDPLTEVPRLEQWFQLSTHPSHSLIVRYTEELNGMPYRKKFPKLETKNVQFWFKNRRAKNKRLNYLDTNNFVR